MERTGSTGRPVGRDQVEEALVVATALLCRDRSPSSVTLREIATSARVNHGQVRHYFGSKDALVVATIEHLESIMLDGLAVSSATDYAETLLRSLDADPAFCRMLGWLLSRDADPTEIGLRFRFGRAMIGRLVEEGADSNAATLAASQIMIICSGWPLLRPMLRASNDLEYEAEVELVDAFAVQVRAIANGVLSVDPVSPAEPSP